MIRITGMVSRLKVFTLVGALCILGQTARAQEEDPRLKRVFDDVDATFVVYDTVRGTTVHHNPEMAQQRYTPFSTFDIWLAAIAAETNVIYDARKKLPLEWNRKAYPPGEDWPSSWKRDHTIGTAFRNSVVWYSQEVAKRIGGSRMVGALQRLGYGNQDMAGGIDRFWLNNGLKISPDEQVKQLARLVRGQTFLSIETVDFVRNLMVLERGGSYVFSGKTGTGQIGEKQWIGWFVGTLEHNSQVAVFALLIEGRRRKDVTGERIALTKKSLQTLGMWFW